MRATIRLIGMGLTLARYDALCPREVRRTLPLPARIALWPLSLFAVNASDTNAGARLAAALEQMGPAAIKLGQLLASRADVFGPDFCAGLSKLKDQLAPIAEAQARAALPADVAARITRLGPAVAAASLAQVHRATLDDGSVRAVKILRPGIQRAVARDAATLRRGAALAQRFIPSAKRLEPALLAETVIAALTIELDLRLEAAAADELHAALAAHADVLIPRIDWSLSRESVLVLDWVEGTPLTRLSADAATRAHLAKTLMQSFLTQALVHGHFHADPHAGNLIHTPDGRLGYVDFGIMGRLGVNERRWLAEMLLGFLNRDYMAVARAHFEAGYVPRHHDIAAFATALRAVGEPIFGQTAADISMARVLEHLFAITGRFDMHLRPELVLLQKTMVTAEGLARDLDPSFNMWDTARPVVEPFVRDLASPLAKLERGVERLNAGLTAWAEAPRSLAALEAALQPRPFSLFPWLALTAVVAGLLGGMVVKLWG
jgi:ubiquinone biosynthesis protein